MTASTGDAAARWDAVLAALDGVEDPEVPITLRDLGVLRTVARDGDRVTVRLVPTRLGCPARVEMARRVRAAVHGVAPDLDVELRWDPVAWRSRDITRGGGAALEAAGYSPSAGDGIRCPYCRSRAVRRDADFGGAICRVPFTCRSCGSTFDGLRSAVPTDR